MRGGATILIRRPVAGEPGAEKNEAPIRYVIGKHLGQGEELAAHADRRRRFADHLGIAGKGGGNPFQVDFAMVHGGI
jgi:hypothetical protein